MRSTRTIDVFCLESLGACASQLALFRQTFGEHAVSVNARTVATARHAQIDVSWLAGTLSDAAYAECQRVSYPAYAECQRVCDAAYAEYQRVCDPAYAECQRVSYPAYAEYQRVSYPAYAEYQRVCDAAYAERQRVCDAHLIRLWNADTTTTEKPTND